MSDANDRPACACGGAGPMVTEIFKRFGPGTEVMEHFRAAELEVLKGIRAMLDQQIASRSSEAPRQGTKITID